MWSASVGDPRCPVVAVALHDGHAVRPDVAAALAVAPADRRREEDPYTAELARLLPNWVVAERSRFEVDLNRPRERAVYQTPAHAWGLRVWRGDAAPAPVVAGSLAAYDAFYVELRELLTTVAAGCGRFAVLDLHAYNHRRDGPASPPADPAGNPEINLGTGALDRSRWAPVVERFLADVRAGGFDARENVRFGGGHLTRWVTATFPAVGCPLAVELKKTFVDEWSGELDRPALDALGRTLAGTLPGLVAALAARGG